MSQTRSLNSMRSAETIEHNYTIVTETPEVPASQEQIARLHTRYRFAAEHSNDKTVLEVACGAGIGLGYLAKFAKHVIGGDIDHNNLAFARKTYLGRDKVAVVSLDAHNLPFADNSFDVVILYEAIYYLTEPGRFIDEARRLLRDNGKIIICTVNNGWSGFNPSPCSVRYFSADELYYFLSNKGFRVEMYGDSPAQPRSLRDKLVSSIKIVAVRLHLMPKTMKGKAILKRVFQGRLIMVPSEIGNISDSDYCPPTSITPGKPDNRHKVIFAVAHVDDGDST